jgi:DNA-binding LytR/AlgR family response regulator
VHTAAEALRSFKSEKPDLILMDVQLNDTIDGIHLAGILKSEYKIPVIFTTAFSDQATLERVKNISPIGYVIKPYTTANIRVTLELAFSAIEQKKTMDIAEEGPTSFINSINGMIKIDPEEISYISAFDYYSNIFIANEKILAKMTLKEVMDQLNAPFLVRVHKSYAVNLNQIAKINNNEIYIGDMKIPIGRAFKEDLKKKIKII